MAEVATVAGSRDWWRLVAGGVSGQLAKDSALGLSGLTGLTGLGGQVPFPVASTGLSKSCVAVTGKKRARLLVQIVCDYSTVFVHHFLTAERR